jgi:hypothetical protein
MEEVNNKQTNRCLHNDKYFKCFLYFYNFIGKICRLIGLMVLGQGRSNYFRDFLQRKCSWRGSLDNGKVLALQNLSERENASHEGWLQIAKDFCMFKSNKKICEAGGE